MRLTESVFETSRPSDLAQKAVRGGAVTFVVQGGKFVLQTGTTIVLARIISPSDFGLIGMVAVVVGFAQTFKDAGLSNATIQRAVVSRDQVDTLFWFNVLFSMALAVAVMLSAPLVADFYGRPELTGITVALSLSILASGISVQHDALLRRYMQFTSIGITQILSQTAYLAVAVCMALLGYGYWAIVGGTLAAAVAGSALTFYYCPIPPRRPRRVSGVVEMLKFGGQLSSFEFVNYFTRNMDNVLVGRFLGADALGLYSRAYQLFLLPITQIRTPILQVAMPLLSSMADQRERLRRNYIDVVSLTALLTVPIALYCFVEADFLVRVLLGPTWLGSVATFRILSLVGLIQPSASTVGIVMQVCGRADRQFKFGLVTAVFVVAAFSVGLRFGIEGVATGYVIASYVLTIPMLEYGFRDTAIRVRDYFTAVLPSLGFGVLSGLGLFTALHVLASQALWLHASAGLGFFALYGFLALQVSSIRALAARMLRSWRTDPEPQSNVAD
jgi:PST family polysaccharide transporter